MAITVTTIGRTRDGRRILRHTQTSVADTANVVTVSGGVAKRVTQVLAAYSATPTQAGVTTALDSGAGAGYDNTLDAGSANARYTAYLPSVPPVIGDDDALVVTAPAGGGVITSSIALYTEDV